MEEKPPYLPTPRQAALASARQEMQAIQAIFRLEGKYAFCIALGTIRKSEKYSRITPPSTPRSGHTKNNPAPAEKQTSQDRPFWRHSRRGEQHKCSWYTYPKKEKENISCKEDEEWQGHCGPWREGTHLRDWLPKSRRPSSQIGKWLWMTSCATQGRPDGTQKIYQ